MERLQLDDACRAGIGRSSAHFHGYLVAKGKGLAVSVTELRALHWVSFGKVATMQSCD